GAGRIRRERRRLAENDKPRRAPLCDHARPGSSRDALTPSKPRGPVLKTRWISAALATAALCGCQTTEAYLNSNQQAALQAANSRGRFELNCQDIQSRILPRNI